MRCCFIKKLLNGITVISVSLALLAIAAVPIVGWLYPRSSVTEASPQAPTESYSFVLAFSGPDDFSGYLVSVDRDITVTPLPDFPLSSCKRSPEECYYYAGATYLCEQLERSGVCFPHGFAVLGTDQAANLLEAIGGAEVEVLPGRYGERTFAAPITVFVGGASLEYARKTYDENAVIRASVMSFLAQNEEIFQQNLILLGSYADTDITQVSVQNYREEREQIRR